MELNMSAFNKTWGANVRLARWTVGDDQCSGCINPDSMQVTSVVLFPEGTSCLRDKDGCIVIQVSKSKALETCFGHFERSR